MKNSKTNSIVKKDAKKVTVKNTTKNAKVNNAKKVTVKNPVKTKKTNSKKETVKKEVIDFCKSWKLPKGFTKESFALYTNEINKTFNRESTQKKLTDSYINFEKIHIDKTEILDSDIIFVTGYFQTVKNKKIDVINRGMQNKLFFIDVIIKKNFSGNEETIAKVLKGIKYENKNIFASLNTGQKVLDNEEFLNWYYLITDEDGNQLPRTDLHHFIRMFNYDNFNRTEKKLVKHSLKHYANAIGNNDLI